MRFIKNQAHHINLELIEPPAAALDHAVDQIISLLQGHSDSVGAEPYRPHPFVLVIRANDGSALGGLKGELNMGWLHVQLLAVHPDHRQAKLGGTLLAAAEQYARDRNCRHSYLDTFSFQAPDFYKKQGYKIFGTLEDFPAGASRIYFTKDLA